MNSTFRNVKCFLDKVPAFRVPSRHKSQTTAEYCWNLVRQHDYENYAATLLMPHEPRARAFAVRGFNVEVAKVGEQVSQNQIGFMRIQFWEDAIDLCFQDDPQRVPKHPIAVELYKALRTTKMSKRYFKSLITSRRNNLASHTFYNLEDMERYADQSVSSVLFLILESCNVRDINADHAASHLGKAQGIINHLRIVPIAKQLKINPLPLELLAKHRVSEEEIYRAKPSERLCECAFEVASRAHQHLTKARSLMAKVPKEGRSALLPAVSADLYLTRLQEVQHDILHPSLQRRHWKLLPQLWLSSFRNKY